MLPYDIIWITLYDIIQIIFELGGIAVLMNHRSGLLRNLKIIGAIALVLSSCGGSDSTSSRNGRLNSALCFDTPEQKEQAIKDAENALVKADITVNKNMVPFDTKSPFVTSGMRVGTAAVTTRGSKEADMKRIVDLIDRALQNHADDAALAQIKTEVNAWMVQFPLY